ncbi:amidohydrolase/deacetylase family metallohydrolase [Pseudogracilibacillus auburnensis]|uniref:Dihydroorotase n=1 Tax=Pseudogracilibacillus auburnensis TaxID=1494959 RepID=A0A2V3W0W3_9BACI|nr:amidohydrolase/deacetylase family metallohydrolase [Pseudogracilibacillus auburnensis]PXW87953.1 dihydroorotase [Pseudogracilibacillus auburnensis]
MIQIIENAMLTTGSKVNIVVKDSKVIEVTNQYFGEGKVISLPEDVYVSPGWIDLHTHSFPKFEPYCAHPDEIGYKTGVTTVVDAGSCGANDIDEFNEVSQKSKTRVFSFINVSSVGLKIRNELEDLSLLSLEAIEKAIEKYPEMIIGLKVRMSASVIGNNDTKALEIAKQFSKRCNKPLMVHIGSSPPKLLDIIQYLDRGDIITHCFNEKPNNHIFSDKETNNALRAAIERGVYLDIGHGTSSFSYPIAIKAREKNIPFHSISTDIYEKNRINGPVYNMATTLSKFLSLGYSLEKVIDSVTTIPAKIMNNHEIGVIQKGAVADLTFFSIEKQEKMLKDSFGNELVVKNQIKPHAVMIGGNYYECKSDEVKTSN